MRELYTGLNCGTGETKPGVPRENDINPVSQGKSKSTNTRI